MYFVIFIGNIVEKWVIDMFLILVRVCCFKLIFIKCWIIGNLFMVEFFDRIFKFFIWSEVELVFGWDGFSEVGLLGFGCRVCLLFLIGFFWVNNSLDFFLS